MSIPMIELSELSKNYGSRIGLEQVTLRVQKGAIYCVIGREKSGKSSLFNLVAGTIKPSSGQVSIQGSHSAEGLMISRKNLGYLVNTHFYQQLTIRENLDYFRRLKGLRERQETSRAMALVGLEKVEGVIKNSSLMTRQLLKVAATIIGSPDIILLDEPTNGLDTEGIRRFWKLIQQLQFRTGATIVISSSSLEHLMEIGTDFAFFHEGRLLETVSAAKLTPRLQEALYLKVSDTPRACVLLEEYLDKPHYKITSDNQIALYTHLDKTTEIVRLFLDNHLELRQLVEKRSSLEDYLMELIGGE